MKRFFQSHAITTGLAIFSMLFGAGNLIYPLKVGVTAGNNTLIGMAAFLVTSVLLPVAGLIAMILFDGNYESFFRRLGSKTGTFFIFICMIIIGPGIVIPRIVTLSHIMIAPFLPGFLSEISFFSSFIFALIFLSVTFICTYKETKIVDLLGKIISPLLLFSLAIIMIKGFFTSKKIIASTVTVPTLITQNILRGYETLDLLGTIFFTSIILIIIKRTMGDQFEQNSKKERVVLGLKAGLFGVSLLGVVYIGMGYLGAYFGHGLSTVAEGELFRIISSRILGEYGAIIIALAVLMACLSTAIGLGSVVGEYFQKEVAHNKMCYVSSLALTLILCLPLSSFGLSLVLKLTAGPITYVGYPMLIVLTLCNIAYKLFGFTPVRLPVALTFVLALASYLY